MNHYRNSSDHEICQWKLNQNSIAEYVQHNETFEVFGMAFDEMALIL